MIDIVFPAGNEAEFIETAKRLGIASLLFVYKDKASFFHGTSAIPVTNALLCDPARIPRAKDLGVPAICPASREALERGANIVFGFETLYDRDKTHYRESGLNHILVAVAHDKSAAIGFSFSLVLSAIGQSRAIIIGRMMQNIVLCRKYAAPVRIASFAQNPLHLRAPAELTSFFLSIGMNAADIKKALG